MKTMSLFEFGSVKGRGRQKTRRGSAIIFVIFMVLAIAGVVVVAAELGMSSSRQQIRYEDSVAAQRTWEAAVAMADAKDQAGTLGALPATFPINLNGVSGTVTVSNNSANMTNSLLVTSTLTTSDQRTYPESSIIATYGSLNGYYWWTNGSSPAYISSAWSWIGVHPTPTGTFSASSLSYSGTDSSTITSFLGADSASYSGTVDNMTEGVIQLQGYITTPVNNTVLQLTTAGGGAVLVDGDAYPIYEDNDHAAQTSTVDIPTAGTYPIFITCYSASGYAAQMSLKWDSSGTQGGSYAAIPNSALAPLNQTWIDNGYAAPAGIQQLLLTNADYEASSAWLPSVQPISTFHASFLFTIGSAVGDGFTFCIQNATSSSLGTGTATMGQGAYNLGYQTINNSFCLAFAVWNHNAQTAGDLIGVSTGGGTPTYATDISSSGIQLNSGDTIWCTLEYSGTTLEVYLADQVTRDTYYTTFTVNIPSAVGANTGYVGFTGGTGSGTCLPYVSSFNFGV